MTTQSPPFLDQSQQQSPPPPPAYDSSPYGQSQSQEYSGPNVGPYSGQPTMQSPPAYPGSQPPDYSTDYPTDGGDSYAFKSPDPAYVRAFRNVSHRYQLLLDATTPHWVGRWTFSVVILLIFMIRIVVAQGWYVICYGLSIYYLNLFIGFLSPKIDPAFQSASEFDLDDLNDSASGPMLPTRANDEFRPFIRRLPEFKFWLSATTATLISLFLTLFEVFDLPVFWPILLLYFILLFVSTMRQQIRHMIKYGYVPWDKGKKKYGVHTEDPASLFSSTI